MQKVSKDILLNKTFDIEKNSEYYILLIHVKNTFTSLNM